jgi:hypothetical protein
MSNSASATMQFNGIDQSEAERLLAVIWRVLEERALASPMVQVRSAMASIDITVGFQSRGDQAIVEKELALRIV